MGMGHSSPTLPFSPAKPLGWDSVSSTARDRGLGKFSLSPMGVGTAASSATLMTSLVQSDEATE